MVFGPVFQVEARLTARRSRTYILRVIYGVSLLLFAQICYERVRATISVEHSFLNSHRAMAEIGSNLFLAVVTFQQVAVFALTPALVAGAIANDRQRGILDHLLATPLPGREIVLGKLASRVLNTAVLLLAGLPIVAIATLFGGIEPRLLLSVYAVAGSTLWLLAGLSILVSAFAKTGREAVVVSYLLVFAWVALPYFLRPLVLVWWTGLQHYLWPMVRALELSEPFHFAELIRRPDAGWSRLWMLVGVETLAGCAFITLAIFRVDSRGARGGEGVPRKVSPGPRRFFRRPRCGLRPMHWKERHVSRLSSMFRLVCVLIGVPLFVVVADQTLDSAARAFREVSAFGYGRSAIDDSQARNGFTQVLRNIGLLASIIWIVSIASIAATSITSEREEDTWTSLISTPLKGEEILRAKRFGAYWRFRYLALLLFGLWVLGLLAGSIHPLAFVILIAAFLASSWFTVNLGTFCSLVRHTSAGAMIMTIAVLLVTNLTGLVMAWLGAVGNPLILLGTTPFHIALATASYEDFAGGDVPFKTLAVYILSGAGTYALGAFILNLIAESIFDDFADRPRSTSQAREVSAEEIRFIEGPPPVESAAGTE